ncbi:MAG: hypothetical protein ACKOEE_07410 [Tagaea sp.]
MLALIVQQGGLLGCVTVGSEAQRHDRIRAQGVVHHIGRHQRACGLGGDGRRLQLGGERPNGGQRQSDRTRNREDGRDDQDAEFSADGRVVDPLHRLSPGGWRATLSAVECFFHVKEL